MARIKYLVIDDFLPEAERAALAGFVLANEAGFEASGVREGAEVRYDPGARRSQLFTASLGELEVRFEAAVRARLDEVFAATGTPPFALAHCEIQLAAHRDGGFYSAHRDTFSGGGRIDVQADRLVSLVYYFRARPDGFSGGELALHPFDQSEPERIEPRDNRLVAFPAVALHAVLPTVCPGDVFASARFSINCWLCRKRED